MNGYIVVFGYILLPNLVPFAVYGIDKYKAKKGRWRISELTLLTLALFGGSIGAWLAVKAFHHKTMYKKFYIGVPMIFVLQIGLEVWVMYKGWSF